MKRLLASVVTAALIIVSPGPFCYEVLAQTVRTAPLGGNGLAGGEIGGQTSGGLTGPSNVSALNLKALRLNSTLPGFAAPRPALAAPRPGAGTPVVPAAAEAVVPALSAPKETAPESKPEAVVEALTQNESIKQLSDEKADKPGVLRWIFDRVKLGKAETAVSGKESAAETTLKPAQETHTAAPQTVPSPISKAKGWFRGHFDLSEFNESEKAFIKGQALFIFSLSVYLASLPFLVQAITHSEAMVGVARAVHYWVLGGASLVVGPIVKNSKMMSIMRGGTKIRALIFAGIGGLAIAGVIPWTGFLVLVGANALVVSMTHLLDLDAGGAAKVFDSDKKIEKAGYIYDTMFYSMMLVGPALMGLPLDWLAHKFGALAGYGAGYVVFGGMMVMVAHIYSKVKPIHDLVADKAQKSWTLLKNGFKDTWATANGKVGFGLLALGAAALAALPWFGIPAAIAAGVLGSAGAIAALHWETLKLIYGNKAILARSLMATVENFVEDALFAVVLPTYAIQTLGAGAFMNGLLMSAGFAGGLLASKLLLSRAQKIQEKIGTYKFLSFLTILASLAFIPSIALWAAPSIWVAIPAVMLMKFMYQPLRSRMRALLQSAIKNDPKAAGHSENIFSLMSFFEVISAGAGGLTFAWLFTAGGIAGAAPMQVVTLALLGISAVYLISLRWVKGQTSTETKALEKLSANLEKMGLPAAKTIKVAEEIDPDHPTVAILSPASVYKLSIAREGGRQSPGDVHLALDPSWLEKTGGKLFLKKGLYFDKDGAAVIAEYKTPRPVRYFANFYTLGANDRDDGVPFEKDLNVPMSNSVQLEKITNDKLVTRLLLSARKVGVPATVAFLMAAHPLIGTAKSVPSDAVFTAAMPKADSNQKELVRQNVLAFLSWYKGDEVVVKPSGPQFHSGYGVKFFPRGDVDAIIEAVIALSHHERMTQDGAVLIDGRLTPPALFMTNGKLDPAGKKKDWNLRVLAARTPWNGGVTTGIFARAGTWGIPTTAEPANPEDAAAVVKYEDVIEGLRTQHGLLKTDAEAAEFRAALDAMGADAVKILAENEAKRTPEPGEALQAQTDYIGLDVMVEVENGKVVPKIIEINDHDAGGQWQLDQFYPEKIGEHSRAWVATMLARARRDAMKGKKIILVGAGYSGKKFFFEKAKELGVQITLIDKPDSWAKDLVAEFIPVDTTEAIEALSGSKEKLLRSARKNGAFDGITTFWEDDIVLTARIAQELGLKYHPIAAAQAARNKFETRKTMAAAGLPSIAFALLKSETDLEAALKKDFPFPAVLKPARGAAAQSTAKVHSPEEARAVYAMMKAELSASEDPIFKQGREIILEEYIDGREWDVDVVMQGGKILYAETTDNWPTREPYFLATGSSSPSWSLSKEEQQAAVALSAKTLAAMGFTDGVFHMEGKTTKTKGPKLLEANARPGGVYVVPWNEKVWGVDLAEMLLVTAAGVPAALYKSPEPLTHLEGEFLLPYQSGTLSAMHLSEEGKDHHGFHELRYLKVVGDRVSVPPDGYERAGMLVARGSSAVEARAHLKHLQSHLTLKVD